MLLNSGWLPRIPLLSVSFLLSVFLLTGCGSKSREIETKPAPKVDKTIVLSANGVGPITPGSSFNMHQMTLAFNDYNVIEEVNYHSGSPYPVIRISEGAKTLMVINPDAAQKNIFSVIIEDNLIKNSLGHHLGMTYSEIYTYGQEEDCQPGSADMAGKVLCYAPQTPNILYVFNGKWKGETGVPPKDVLNSWALESIIWRPKS